MRAKARAERSEPKASAPFRWVRDGHLPNEFAPGFPSGEQLPLDIAFLAKHGVPAGRLQSAARLSADRGTLASHELLSGGFNRRLYWSLLADDLGLAFVDRLSGAEIVANAGMLVTDAVRLATCVLVRRGAVTVLVLAPLPDEIPLLQRHLAETPTLAARLRIATPETIRAFLVVHRHAALTHYAVNRLARVLPPLSARNLRQARGASGTTALVAAVVGLALLSPLTAAKALALLSTAFFFNCSVWKMAAALRRVRRLRVEPVFDQHLPSYTVLVPLYREARVTPDLVTHLKKIDYPALCIKRRPYVARAPMGVGP